VEYLLDRYHSARELQPHDPIHGARPLRRVVGRRHCGSERLQLALPAGAGRRAGGPALQPSRPAHTLGPAAPPSRAVEIVNRALARGHLAILELLMGSLYGGWALASLGPRRATHGVLLPARPAWVQPLDAPPPLPPRPPPTLPP
jgi:hypothetical protein